MSWFFSFMIISMCSYVTLLAVMYHSFHTLYLWRSYNSLNKCLLKLFYVCSKTVLLVYNFIVISSLCVITLVYLFNSPSCVCLSRQQCPTKKTDTLTAISKMTSLPPHVPASEGCYRNPKSVKCVPPNIFAFCVFISHWIMHCFEIDIFVTENVKL